MSQIRRKRSLYASAGLILATALLITGCSSGSGQASTNSSTQASNAGKDLGTLRIVTSSQSLNFIGVTGDLGQWKGTGLSVTILSGGSKTNTSALASGSADVSLQAGDTAALAIAKGLKAKIVGALLLPWNQLLIAGTKSGATSPADLKGKVFGITSFGSGGDYATQVMAKKLGWTKSQYKEVTIGGGPAGLTAALKQGKIDAFYWNAGVAYQLEQEGIGKVVGDATKYVGPTVFQPVVVSDAVIKNHPEQVKALMEGFQKAVKTIKADPDKAVNILVNDWGQKKEPSQRAVQALLPQLNPAGTIPDKNLDGLAGAVSFDTKGATVLTDSQLKSMYTPWTTIGK